MKYQVGDKVKYDSGDWWFFGTVTAVIENSICPSYRLSVDRMEKKNCRFSITQFDFELEADNEAENDKDKCKWENLEKEYLKKYFGFQQKEESFKVAPVSEPKPEPEPEPKPVPELKPEPELMPVPEPEPEPVPELKPIPEPVQVQEPMPEPEPEPMLEQELKPVTGLIELKPEKKQRRKRGQKSELNMENVETSQEPGEEAPKRRRGDAWERNYELYKKGQRTNIIHAWVSQNRKLYKTGELNDEKLEKLIEINFPFEIQQIRRNRK